MISSSLLPTRLFYYPFGDTPPVCLTQDLPPEQEADILLLGCGDARNILFTCFVDNARRMDLTCCDIEPGIHARNILLYSLFMDEEAILNIDKMWNIYYHWKLDQGSLELLESRTEKLLELSESIDRWHSSVYGSTIRFCDDKSLACVRGYWSNFSSQGLSPSDNAERQRQFQARINRAKSFRGKGHVENTIIGLRSALPALNSQVMSDVSKITEQWWDCGTVPLSSEVAMKSTHLNPAFLYAPTEALTLHYRLSPLLGFPLCTANTEISEGSAFYTKLKDAQSTSQLVESAKRHFAAWALSFNIAVANKLRVRIFVGDALALCFTLCTRQLTPAGGIKSEKWFRSNWTNGLINLHESTHGRDVKPTPLRFDVIDTSNLANYLGALNLLSLGSVLLKQYASSSLYTETIHFANLADRLSVFLSEDVRAMSLLLGLVLPDLFTNATNSVEEDFMMGPICSMLGGNLLNTAQRRSRLRWKRPKEFQMGNDSLSVSGLIEVEASSLAGFLVSVYRSMFKHEDPTRLLPLRGDPVALFKEVSPTCCSDRYTRASFAFLLSALKANVITDWVQCVEEIYNGVFSNNPFGALSLNFNSAQDLSLSMHLFGVDSGRFMKPSYAEVKNAILAPVLPLEGELPDQLCVTIRVSRKCLNKLETKRKLEDSGCPAIVLSIEGGEPGQVSWLNFFSSVQITFGKWHKQQGAKDSYPYIEEDHLQLSGLSDMYVSAFVPTFMLLQSKRSVPLAKCGFMLTASTIKFSKELGPNLCFASSEMTSKDVFVTKFMPGTTGLPNYTFLSNHRNRTSLQVTSLLLTNESKSNLLRRRLILEDETAKEKLATKSSAVKVVFKSPFTALISIGESLKLELDFPVPVSMSKFHVRFGRKSSFVEVESPFLDPLEADAANFMFPVFLSKVPSGVTVPIPWTAMRVNLDALPALDLRSKQKIAWLNPLLSAIFSKREVRIRESSAKNDVRTDLKDGLFSIFMQFAGLQGLECRIFGISRKDSGVQTLIFASCLRLDLANLSVVLDAAVVPLTFSMLQKEEVFKFLEELTDSGLLCQVMVTEAENVAWKAILPVMVERCRANSTWKHSSRCEYLKVGEAPVPKGLTKEGKSPICSCGVGKFPSADYLKDLKERFPGLSHVLNRYATRAAIAPIFAVPYVEDTLDLLGLKDIGSVSLEEEVCKKCGKSERTNSQASSQFGQGLKQCSKCGMVKYCSRECQKLDWKRHKPLCKTR